MRTDPSVVVHTRADKPFTPQNSFQGRQQFPVRIYLENISPRTVGKGCSCHVCIVVLRNEEYFGIRLNFGYSMGGFDSIQGWKPDIEQNQVWFQFFGFLNGF